MKTKMINIVLALLFLTPCFCQNSSLVPMNKSLEKLINIVSKDAVKIMRIVISENRQIVVRDSATMVRYTGNLGRIDDVYHLDSVLLNTISNSIINSISEINNKKNNSLFYKIMDCILFRDDTSKRLNKYEPLDITIQKCTDRDYFLNLKIDVFENKLICNYEICTYGDKNKTKKQIAGHVTIPFHRKDKVFSELFYQRAIEERSYVDKYIYPIFAEACMCDDAPNKPRVLYGSKVKGYEGLLTSYHSLSGCNTFYTFDENGTRHELNVHSVDMSNDIALLHTHSSQKIKSINYGYDKISTPLNEKNLLLASFEVKQTDETYPYKLLIKPAYVAYFFQSPNPEQYEKLDEVSLSQTTKFFQNKDLQNGMNCINIPDKNNIYFFMHKAIEPGMPALGYENMEKNTAEVKSSYGIVNGVKEENISWVVPFRQIHLERCNMEDLNAELPPCQVQEQYYLSSNKAQTKLVSLPKKLNERLYIQAILSDLTLPEPKTGEDSFNEKVFSKLNNKFCNKSGLIQRIVYIEKLFKNFDYPLTFSYGCLYLLSKNSPKGQNNALKNLIEHIPLLLDIYYNNNDSTYSHLLKSNKRKIKKDFELMETFGVTGEKISTLFNEYNSKEKDISETLELIGVYENTYKAIEEKISIKNQNLKLSFDSIYNSLRELIDLYNKICISNNSKTVDFKSDNNKKYNYLIQHIFNSYNSYLVSCSDTLKSFDINEVRDSVSAQYVVFKIKSILEDISKVNLLFNLKPDLPQLSDVEKCIKNLNESTNENEEMYNLIAMLEDISKNKLDTIYNKSFNMLKEQGKAFAFRNEEVKEKNRKPLSPLEYTEIRIEEENKNLEAYKLAQKTEESSIINSKESEGKEIKSYQTTLIVEKKENITRYDLGATEDNEARKAIRAFFETLFKIEAQFPMSDIKVTVYGLADGYFYSSDFKYDGKYGDIDFVNHTDKEGNFDTRKSTPHKYNNIQLSNRMLALVRAKFVQYYFEICYFSDSQKKFRPNDDNLFQNASTEKGGMNRGIRIEAVYKITKELSPAQVQGEENIISVPYIEKKY